MREEAIVEFRGLGVTSFDSTSAFRQSFKDDRDNYHTTGRTYTAIRVPQVEGNAKLKRNIEAGRIARRMRSDWNEQCMAALAVQYTDGDGRGDKEFSA